MRHPVTVAALVALCLGPHPASAGPVRFDSPADSLRADESLTWTLPVRIMNTGSHGLYVDSLWMDVRATSGATQRIDFGVLVRGMAPISVGDSNTVRVSLPATLEQGTGLVTLVAHDGDGAAIRATFERPVARGELARYPSRISLAQGKRVEWVRVPAAEGSAPAAGAPGLLLVHGHAGSARDMLRMALSLAGQGIEVVCVSMPGYGMSEGPADFMGPATRRAVTLALDSLAAGVGVGVDRTHLAIWGVSRGATAALLVAAERPEVTAVVAQAAVYDVAAVHGRLAGTELGGNLLREAGRDSAAWKARSPLGMAVRAKASVLVLHGEEDEVSAASDARAYVAQRQKLGLPVTEQILAGQKHQINRAVGNRAALTFLKDALGLTRP